MRQESSPSLTTSLEKKVFEKPVFIVSAPRSGSTLLFETLITSSHIWSIRKESHGIYAQFPELQFENAAQDSACLNKVHYSPELSSKFKSYYFQELRDHEGNLLSELKKKTALPNLPF